MSFFCVVVLLAITGIHQVQSQIQSQGPSNAVTVIGSNVTMKCGPATCSNIEWTVERSSQTSVIFSKVINTDFKDRYRIINSPGCDLVITKVQLSDAGRFTCSFNSTSSFVKSASLVVLKSLISCSADAPSAGIAEGDKVTLKCSLSYNGADNVSVSWLNDAPPPVKTVNNITSSYPVVARSPTLPSYRCLITFKFAPASAGAATNDPTTSCNTAGTRVMYSAKDVILQPSSSLYLPGSEITCSAKGDPPPTYKWQVLMKENGKPDTWKDIPGANGPKFLVKDQFACSLHRCVASNTVKGATNSSYSSSFQLYQSDIVNDSSRGPGMGIGVLIGVVICALLIAMVLFLLLKLDYLRLQWNGRRKSPDSSSEEERPPEVETPQSNQPHYTIISPEITANAALRETNVYETSDGQEATYANLEKKTQPGDNHTYTSLSEIRKPTPKKKPVFKN